MPDFKNIYTLNVQPGIQRDGTTFSGNNWTAGEWVRFYRGNPRKMGGYTLLSKELPAICRGIFLVPSVTSAAPTYNIFVGTYEQCYYFVIDDIGNVITNLTPITPVGFEVDPSNSWTFDLAPNPNASSSGISLVAHAAPNIDNLANNQNTYVYYTDAYNPGQLQRLEVNYGSDTSPDIQSIKVSGGIVTLYPFLFAYGNSGEVTWINMQSDTNLVDGQTTISGMKVIAATGTRGGNAAPSGLFFALDRLVRATFVGTNGPIELDFTFDVISTQSSILSQDAWIEHDSLYYWAGIDRFLMYNGVVQELPNSNSLQFFFENLDFTQREKVFAAKVPHWGEIWWFFPTKDSDNQECNWAVIYNVRERIWYDTPIKRSAGTFSQTFPLPIWTDSTADGGGYPIWLQEVGTDKVVPPAGIDPGSITPIKSSITTPFVSYAATNFSGQSEQLDRWTYMYRLELDALQIGDMDLIVSGRKYARSANEESVYPFTATTPFIDIHEQRRLLRLKFESNTEGGTFELGRCLVVATPGDSRQ